MSRTLTKILSASMIVAISIATIDSASASSERVATAGAVITAPAELIRSEPAQIPTSLSPNTTVVGDNPATSRGPANTDRAVTEEVADGQQTTFTISSPDSEHTRTFDFNLTEESRIEQIDGFFFIVENDRPVIRISAPWAKDAYGNDVTTWFTTDGKTLTQHVERTGAGYYPLTVDPRWTWGRISEHVYFSKEETKKFAAAGASAAAVGPFWWAVPQPFGAAIAGWWTKNSLHVTETATRAVAGNKCIQLKVRYIGLNGAIGIEPAEYTDGCN